MTLISMACLGGALVAGIVWLNLKVEDDLARLPPHEREQIERDTDEEAGLW